MLETTNKQIKLWLDCCFFFLMEIGQCFMINTTEREKLGEGEELWKATELLELLVNK